MKKKAKKDEKKAPKKGKYPLSNRIRKIKALRPGRGAFFLCLRSVSGRNSVRI